MKIKDILLSSLTLEEQKLLHPKELEDWRQTKIFQEFRESNFFLSFELLSLIGLINNQFNGLNQLAKNPYRLFHYLGLEFGQFWPQDWLRDWPLTTEEKFIRLSDIQVLYEKFTPYVENFKATLSAAIQERAHLSPSENPKGLYYKLYYNAILALEKTVLHAWQEILKQGNQFKELEDYFVLDFVNFNLKPKFSFDENKTWLDLAPTYYYFNKEKLRSCLLSLKGITGIHNKEDAIKHLALREEYILEGQEFGPLKEAIEQYHHINKSVPKNRSRRIKALANIAKIAAALSAKSTHLSQAQQKTLSEIASQATHKLEYLRECLFIPKKLEKRAFRLEHVQGKPLVVDKADWFGDLDPAHRKLPGLLFQQWEREALSHSNTPDFWSYLEYQDPFELENLTIDPRYTIPKSDKLVTIKEGICFNALCSSQKDRQITDGVYLYNIDKENNLYILPSPPDFGGAGKMGKELEGQGIKSTISFNHNSVLWGENVKCAGCIYFKNGKIVQIDTNSGHYKPTMSHLQSAIKNSLLAKGAFAPDAIVTDYNGTVEISVQNFIAKDFDIYKHFPHERQQIPLEEIQNLIKKMKKINSAALIKAVKKGQTHLVKQLLKLNIDLDYVDNDNWTALMWAVYKKYDKIVIMLIEKSKPFSPDDKNLRLLLILALNSNKGKILDALLKNGANIDIPDEDDQSTLLMWAAKAGHLDFVKMLLNHGANVALKDKQGKTALEYAHECPSILANRASIIALIEQQSHSAEKRKHLVFTKISPSERKKNPILGKEQELKRSKKL